MTFNVSAETVSVELEDGSKVNCTREAATSSSSEKCGSFKCDAITIQGKSYSPTLIYDTNPDASSQASIHLINEQQDIGPLVAVKKIFAKSSSKPLSDYSNFLMSLKDRFDEDYMKTTNKNLPTTKTTMCLSPSSILTKSVIQAVPAFLKS
jgi:hypothetical protein